MRKLKRYILAVAALAMGGMMLSDVTNAAERTKYWEQRVSLFDKLPVVEGDIVFLGNSITDGGEFNELFDIENAKNRGISGDVIDGVIERLDQVTDGHPAKIFLLIGINDISHAIETPRLAGRYERLVKQITEKSPETELYIQSVMPINNDFKRYKNLRGQEKAVPALNEEIVKIADKYGATYIDLWPALADENGKLKKEYTNDGLHLTGPGYKAWAAAIKDYVMK